MLIHGFRRALRAIFANPGFSALVVGVLASGLACVVFMLAFLDGLVFGALPFAAPNSSTRPVFTVTADSATSSRCPVGI